MSKRHGRRGPQEGQAPRPQAGPQPRRDGGGQPQSKGPGWVQLRDSIRRDLEVATQSLAFLERFGEGLDSQRRLFVDFPRVTEELRTGAMERLAGAMERLYEGGPQALDLNRFLRDLPLALGHLASAELAARRQAQEAASAKLAKERAPASDAAQAAPATNPAADGEGAPSAEAAPPSDAPASTDAPAPAEPAASGDAPIEASAPAAADTVEQEARDEAAEASAAAEAATAALVAAEVAAESTGAAPGAVASDSPPASTAAATELVKSVNAGPEPVSPRVELRARLLAAAPQLNKASQSFRRNTATVRRAASPRRAVGPWRSDHEVLEQARRAVEFASKIYDTYAEAWADAPLSKSAGSEAAAETDRFLAWTQLSRYAEVARTQSSLNTPKPHEAAPGVKSEKSTEPASEPSAPSETNSAPSEATP